MIFWIIPTMAQEQCHDLIFQEPKKGYRCITNKYTAITDVPHHLCTHACMQRNCNLINYNHEKHYCQLSSGDCLAETNAAFIVTVLRFHKCLPVTVSPCIQWVPVADVVADRNIQCAPNDTAYQLGRLSYQGSIMLGKYSDSTAWVWINGAAYDSTVVDDLEILQLQPGCSAKWVPYSPGELFPARAVIGGYLGDACFGTPIIRGLTINGKTYRCGYYNIKTQLGYMVYFQAEVATEMDILVLE